MLAKQSKQELFTLAKKYSKTVFAISQQVLAELDINKTRSQNQNKHCRFILEKFQTLPNFEVQSQREKTDILLKTGETDNDKQIVGHANDLQEKNSDKIVFVVTKDVNMRNFCTAEKIMSGGCENLRSYRLIHGNYRFRSKNCRIWGENSHFRPFQVIFGSKKVISSQLLLFS